RLRLLLEPTGSPPPPHEAIDALFSLVVRVARLLRDDRAVAPLRVELQRPEPSPSEPFRRFFRAPVAFARSSNAIDFSLHDADAPLPTGNAELARRIDEV